jgi:glycosyltransferase involved in cell wall biosynthesis
LLAIFTIDEALHDYMERFSHASGAPVVYLPDPADVGGSLSRIQARERLSIHPTAFVILVYGTIDARKGLDTLLAALDQPSVPDRVTVFIAGKQDAAVDRMLQQPLARALGRVGRVLCLNKFLDTEEQNAVFAAADIVWLGYQGHYAMSGVMVQAGQMGLPTIACAEGLIGWITGRLSSGLTVRVEDTKGVAEAILKLVEDRSLAETLGRNGRDYFRQHSVERFSAGLFNALEGCSFVQ